MQLIALPGLGSRQRRIHGGAQWQLGADDVVVLGKDLASHTGALLSDRGRGVAET